MLLTLWRSTIALIWRSTIALWRSTIALWRTIVMSYCINDLIKRRDYTICSITFSLCSKYRVSDRMMLQSEMFFSLVQQKMRRFSTIGDPVRSFLDGSLMVIHKTHRVTSDIATPKHDFARPAQPQNRIIHYWKLARS